ncbi:MAG: hypothetical protein IKK33_08570 [Lachnospiraceae bacterium]|nr:hypothetical protein [Lachnospiraceae bacterium]
MHEKMAQNRNGSEPLVVCGEKGQKVMWSMGVWGKSGWFWHRKFGLRKRRKDGIDC